MTEVRFLSTTTQEIWRFSQGPKKPKVVLRKKHLSGWFLPCIHSPTYRLGELHLHHKGSPYDHRTSLKTKVCAWLWGRGADPKDKPDSFCVVVLFIMVHNRSAWG